MSRPTSRLSSLGSNDFSGFSGGLWRSRPVPMNVNGTALLPDPQDSLFVYNKASGLTYKQQMAEAIKPKKRYTAEDVAAEIAAINANDPTVSAPHKLKDDQEYIESLDAKISRLEDEIFQRKVPSYLGTSTAGETRRPIVAKIGTAQPDPKAAIAARAAAKEQERERKRAALPTLKANAFKADYQPRWSSLRAGSPANYGPLSKGGDQCTASGRN